MRELTWKWVVIIGMVIIAITLLEIIALLLGYNGTLLKIVLIILAGLGGISIPSPFQFQKKEGF